MKGLAAMLHVVIHHAGMHRAAMAHHDLNMVRAQLAVRVMVDVPVVRVARGLLAEMGLLVAVIAVAKRGFDCPSGPVWVRATCCSFAAVSEPPSPRVN